MESIMYDVETGPAPLTYETLDRLRHQFQSVGSNATIASLCDELRQSGDYGALFYALLMQKRIELGVSPFPMGPASELPPELHDAYEDAIRHAGRTVGQLYLDQAEFGRAYTYYHMLGETDTVTQAINRYELKPDADCQPFIELALHHGLNPTKGFDVVLDRYGICNAITTVSSIDLSKKPEVFAYCVKRLIRSLSEQLQERLRGEIINHGETDPGNIGVSALMQGRDWLFADDAYHIDISHLSSVMQMSIHVTDGEDLTLARELCQYGQRLAPAYQSQSDAPFEQGYIDFEKYLDVLIGDRREAGLQHFRAKVAELDDVDHPYPAEVLVNLLLKVDQLPEAVTIAKRYLTRIPDGQLSCPGV